MTATELAVVHLRGHRPTHGPLSSVNGRACLLALAALIDEDRAAGAGRTIVTDAAVARIVGIAPSTACSWLRTLVEVGLVVRTSPHTFTLARQPAETVTVAGGTL